MSRLPSKLFAEFLLSAYSLTTFVMSQSFSQRVLKWFDQHGRKHLPWQQKISPYRVWLSEIMLQQTQVTTVIPYFETFTKKFPQLKDLAAASTDEVLHLWTGLGYYARARNLHHCAKTIVAQHNGKFPQTLEELCELKGIGRSTAGAILSIAFEQRAAILDGNVKRVLARYHAVNGYPGDTKVAQQLWQWAETHTPKTRNRDYTQAMMDLGATLCTKSKPRCAECPLKKDCIAFATETQRQYPGKKNKNPLPEKSVQVLMIENDEGDFWLEQRAPSGLWGGLWCFPEIDAEKNPTLIAQETFGRIQHCEIWPSFRHTFSHFHLDITPVLIKIKIQKNKISEKNGCWYSLKQPPELGLAAPVKKLLSQLKNYSTQV